MYSPFVFIFGSGCMHAEYERSSTGDEIVNKIANSSRIPAKMTV